MPYGHIGGAFDVLRNQAIMRVTFHLRVKDIFAIFSLVGHSSSSRKAYAIFSLVTHVLPCMRTEYNITFLNC